MSVKKVASVQMRADCPECANAIEFPVDLRGETVGCPHCGKSIQLGSAPAPAAVPPLIPIAQAPYASMQMPHHVTTERTAKPIKAMMAIFSLALLGSILIVVFSADESMLRAVGFLGVAVSFIALIVTRLVRWWEHD